MCAPWLRSSFVISCAAAALLGQEPPFDPQRLERLPRLLAEEVEAGRYAGISFVVQHGGRDVASAAFGLADVADGRPLRTDAIVRVYSMSKPITAIAALTLVERGQLRLGQPIDELLPEFAAPQVFAGGTADQPELVPAQRRITVRMLLNHTAGFTYDFGEEPVHELYRRAQLWQARSSEDFVRRAATLPLLAEPGLSWSYGIANDVLGIVIERATGQPLGDVVRECVTGPLGMVDTDFDVEPEKRERLAVLHRRGDDGLVAVEPVLGAFAEPGRGFPSGGAGMFSTLRDYARFARFLIGDGTLDGRRVLGRRTLEVARLDTLRDGQRTSQSGVGWNLFSAVVVDAGAAHELLGQGTLFWNGAATTCFFADPHEQVVAVMFAQHLPFDEHHLISRFRTLVQQALR